MILQHEILIHHNFKTSLYIFNYSKEKKIFQQIFLRDNPAKLFFFFFIQGCNLTYLKIFTLRKITENIMFKDLFGEYWP